MLDTLAVLAALAAALIYLGTKLFRGLPGTIEPGEQTKATCHCAGCSHGGPGCPGSTRLPQGPEASKPAPTFPDPGRAGSPRPARPSSRPPA